MATIGSVTKRDDGRYEGELRTLTIRAESASCPWPTRSRPNQPDYRVISQGIEIGAGWVRKVRPPARSTSSLSIAAPEFGAKTLYANLGRAAGQRRSRRLRADLEPARLSAPRSRPRAILGAGAFRALLSGLALTRSAPPTRPAGVGSDRRLVRGWATFRSLILRCSRPTVRRTSRVACQGHSRSSGVSRVRRWCRSATIPSSKHERNVREGFGAFSEIKIKKHAVAPRPDRSGATASLTPKTGAWRACGKLA